MKTAEERAAKRARQAAAARFKTGDYPEMEEIQAKFEEEEHEAKRAEQATRAEKEREAKALEGEPKQDEAKKSTELQIDYEAGISSALAENTCPGCFLGTCPRRHYMCMAVAKANSLISRKDDPEKTLMMSPEERADWFIALYNEVKGVDPGSKYGVSCARKYAQRKLDYKSAAYLLATGALRNDDDEEYEYEGFSESSSYVSSNYERYLSYQNQV
jgi:hypothetical protein